MMKKYLIIIFVVLSNIIYGLREDFTSNDRTFTLENFSQRIRERLTYLSAEFIESAKKKDGYTSYKSYWLSESKRNQIIKELSNLPEFWKKIFLRVVNVGFIENFNSTALIYAHNDRGKYFNMLINPTILNESLEDYLTRRLNTAIKSSGGIEIEVKTDKDVSGLVVLVVHELAHALDYICQTYETNKDLDYHLPSEYNRWFSYDVWKDEKTPVLSIKEDYGVVFYGQETKVYDINEVRMMCNMLLASDFPSFYSLETKLSILESF